MARDFGRVHAEPWAGGSRRASELEQVVEYGIEQIDRHEHIALYRVVADRFLHQQRSDAEEPPRVVEERGAAPFRMRRRGEQRLVEHVFPVAGEFALGDHLRLERVRASAMADDEDIVVDRDRRGAAAFEIGRGELAQRQHQAESGREIVGKRMAGDRRPAIRREPYRFGFGDQIADSQRQAVFADHHAVAAALGAENRRGERIVGNHGPEHDDRVQRGLEIESDVARARLQLRRERPVSGFGHGRSRILRCSGTQRHVTPLFGRSGLHGTGYATAHCAARRHPAQPR